MFQDAWVTPLVETSKSTKSEKGVIYEEHLNWNTHRYVPLLLTK